MHDRDHTIRFAVRAFKPFETALEKVWKAYCDKTGCRLRLEAEPMELPALHEAIIGSEGLKHGDYDIAHINTDWIAAADATGAVEDLSPYVERNSPEDYPGGWSGALLGMQDFDGRLAGLPFHDGPECLIYRKDLFEDAVEKENYFRHTGKALEPPGTWDDFISVAAFFQRPEENLWGTVLAMFPDGHNTIFDFCLQLWSRGGELTDPEGNIRIDSPQAIEALEFYRKIGNDGALLHPKCAEFESVRAGMAFARGEVAMMVNWFGFASVCEVDPASRVKGKVDITDIPHGPGGKGTSLNVYWMYAIGSGSRHKEVAYDFVRFAISRENDKLLTLEGGIGCRLSTWGDREVNGLVPYYSRLKGLHENSRTLPRHRHWASAAAIIDEVVLKATSTTLPAAELLKRGQQRLNETINNDGLTI